MSNIPKHFQTFIKENSKFLNELYTDNYKKDNINTHGLIYMKYISSDSNLDIAYITYNDLINNKILEKDIIDNIKKDFDSKKIIYINDNTNNYILLI
jgi:hypothetical protein